MKIVLTNAFISDVKNIMSLIKGCKADILQYIMVNVQEKYTTFTGSSMEQNITVKIPYNAEKDIGKTFLLNGKDFLKKMEMFKKRDMFVLTIENDKALLSDNHTTVEVMTSSDIESFPPLMDAPCSMTRIIGMNVGHFTRKMAMTCETYEYGHPRLMGVAFKNENGKLLLLSTDERRLVKCSTDIDINDSLLEIPLIVPTEVCKILSKVKSVIDFGFSTVPHDIIDQETKQKTGEWIEPKYFRVEFGVTQIISRLCDAKFPDYTRIFPKDFTREIFVDRKTFLEYTNAVGKLHVLNGVLYKISQNKMEIYNNSMKTSIPCQLFGNDVEVALKSRYLNDFLKHSESQRINIKYASPTMPVVIDDIDGKDSIVVMYMTM